MNYRNNLFREFDLSSSLSNFLENIRSEIKGMDLKRITETDENILVKEILGKNKLEAPTLKDNEKKINPVEADIQINRNSRDAWAFDYDDGRPIVRKGLRIEVRIPFEGDGRLFKCRASTYSISGSPEGTVEGDELVLSYETTEKDPAKIKNLWENDIARIKENLTWIKNDLDRHNNSLEPQIRSLLAARRKEAQDNQSLIDSIRN